MAARQDFAACLKIDLQPIGDDGFDFQGFVEGQSSDKNPGPPIACGRGFIRCETEGMERFHRFRRPQGLHELSQRRIDLHDHGVAGRKRAVAVEKHKRKMQSIAGAPDSPFSIDRALDALHDGLAADVEVTHGQGGVVVDSQVTGVVSGLGGHEESPVGKFEDGETVAVARGFAEELVLEVVGPNPSVGQRPPRKDIGRHNMKRAVLLELGGKTDVRGDEIAGDAGGGIEVGVVVGIFAGIVAILPAVVTVAVGALEIIPAGIAGIIGAVLIDQGGLGDDGLIARRTRVSRIPAVESQDDAEEAAGIFLEQ